MWMANTVRHMALLVACLLPVVFPLRAQPPDELSYDIAGASSVIRTAQPVADAAAGSAALYQRARVGRDFRYRFTGLAPEQVAIVDIGFAELQPEQAMARSFRVELNGLPALGPINILREAGGTMRAMARRLTVTPARGEFELRFVADSGEACVSFIRLRAGGRTITATTDPRPPSAAAVSNGPADRTAPGGQATWNADTGEIMQDGRLKPWLSGVPLGGIGTGKFEVLPNGAFGNFTTNNSWDLPVQLAPGSFFAICVKSASGRGAAWMLRADDTLGTAARYANTRGPGRTVYRGIFPFAELKPVDATMPILARVGMWSAVVPHDPADSSLPVAFFDVELENPRSEPVSVAVALSFENIIGRGGSARPGDQFGGWRSVVHNDAGTTGLVGIYMAPSGAVPAGRAATFVGDWFVGVESAGVYVTRVLNWNPQSYQVPWWSQFTKTLRLDRRDGKNPVWGTDSNGTDRSAAVLCATTNLGPNEKKIIPFYVAWYTPNIYMGSGGSTHVRQAYASRFGSSLGVAAHARANRVRLYRSTAEWWGLVRASNLPAWLKVNALNAASPIVTNTVNFEGGPFAMLASPGDRRGAVGFLGHRAVAGGFLAAMYPGLDRSELLAFAAAQGPDGRLPESLGNIHEDLSCAPCGMTPTDRPDLAANFIIEAARHSCATGDSEFLGRAWPAMKRAAEYLHSCDRDRDGIAEGGTEYDRFQDMPGAFSYMAGLELAALRAAAYGASLMGDAPLAREYGARFAAATRTVETNLWDAAASMLVKVADPLRGKRAETSFASALAGDWAARAAGLGPALPVAITRPAVEAIVRRHFGPGYGAPPIEVDIGGRPSSPLTVTPPLAAHVGCEAVAVGQTTQGLQVLHQLMDTAWGQARNPWGQALFAYVADARPAGSGSTAAAAAAWSALAAVTGFAYFPADGTAVFEPRTVPEMQGRLSAPVFTPAFWGWIDYSEKSTSGTLKVLRVMAGNENRVVRRVVRQTGPRGETLRERVLDPPIVLRPGASIALERRPVEFSVE